MQTFSLEFSDGDERNLNLAQKMARVQTKNEEFRNAIRGLEYLLIQHEFKHGKKTPHIDLFEDRKLLGICFQSIGDLTNALKHFEEAEKLAKQIFIAT
jgi:tetratricopeptide (TPR) repeat protein